jgi:hypothetical protein
VAPPFIRPLYPPSSPKKSEGGIDVMAVKRGVSRMGLWPWQEFDDTYSQRFATEGVASFRKSAGLTKGLVYDAATHAKLSAARVPKDLPHAGELAFDATAISLLERAKKQQTPPEVQKAIDLLQFCKLFTGPYRYGGEHDASLTDDKPSDAFDCSSSCSFALYHVGLLGSSEAQVSGWFKSWGRPGRGQYVTVHAADDHVWMDFSIPGHPWCRFDTSPHGCGSFGPRVRTCARSVERFVPRHPPGM